MNRILFLFFFVSTAFFSSNCRSQSNDKIQTGTDLYASNTSYADEEEVAHVKSYFVEERINMTFGGRIVTYEVSHPSLIDTHDLGPNNSRIVKPKYNKKSDRSKKKEIPQQAILNATGLLEKKSENIAEPEKKDYVVIDKARTYERILEKGYESVEMLHVVANRRFFDEDYAAAAKWYAKLFQLATNLDVVYHYRFAKCLQAIGEHQKASELLKVFERNSGK